MLSLLNKEGWKGLTLFVVVLVIGSLFRGEASTTSFSEFSLIPIQLPFYFNWLSMTASIFIIAAQGISLNQMLIGLALVNKESYLVAALYVLFSLCLQPFAPIPWVSLIGFFIIWLFFEISKMMKKEKLQLELFNIGLIVSLMTMIDVRSFFFFPFILSFVLIYKSLKWKEYVGMIGGFILPIGWYASILYLFDSGYVWDDFKVNYFKGYAFVNEISLNHWIFIAFMGLILLMALVRLNGLSSKVSLENRRLMQALFLYVLCWGLVLLIQPTINAVSFIPLLFPVAIFTGLMLQQIQVWLLGEIVFITLVLGVLFLQSQWFIW